MPVFIAALWGALIQIVGTLAGRVLVALGIGVVTYTGINASLEALKTQAIGALSGLPPELLGLLGLLKVGQCISIIMSATAARLLLNGMTGDTVKKWVIK